MADNSFYGYRLTLSFYGQDGKPINEKKDSASVPLVRTFINNLDTDITFTRDGSTNSEQYGRANLSRLDYHKHLYSPNSLNVTLEFTGTGILDKMFNIANIFCGAKAKLEVINIIEKDGKEKTTFTEGESKVTVAESYVVYDVKPSYNVTQKSKLYLLLTIFSPDKALDTFKYSKAHTGKTLGSGIIGSELKNLMPSNPITVDTSGMKVLTAAGYEFIQPYAVQYDETFYGFISRIANRCGEFLFYEGPSLNLGVKLNNLDSVGLSYFDQISFDRTKPEEAKEMPTSVYHNYVSTTKGDGIPSSGSFINNTEISTDEYLETVKKDGFASSKDENNYIGNAIPVTVSTIFTNSMGAGLFKALMGMIMEFPLGDAKARANKINDKFNKKLFKDSNVETKPLYSSPDATGKEFVNLNTAFYNAVRTDEEMVSKNLLKLQITSRIENSLKLGDAFSFKIDDPNDNSKKIDLKYVIIGIDAKFEVVTEGNRSRIVQPVEITASPVLQHTFGTTQYELPVPPMAVSPIRRIGPQKATVSDVEDHAGLGRVRVRFNWQKDSDDQSPWIRVTGLMANSNGGTAYFKAAPGDSVLIDFENDNADKPYVSGFLPDMFQKKNKGQHQVYGNSVVVSSENGQMMLMRDDAASSSSSILGDAVQGMSCFFPGLPSMSESKDERKRYFGSTVFTDYYGLYSLEMSSTAKSISINSPFGKVSMNAFTGVSINCPNGDVSINAKNIKLEARNNINITSGTSTDDLTFRWMMDAIIGGIADYGADKVKAAFDLEYLRHIIEIFIKPVEGTLSLKSGRFLMLQAGGAKAGVPKTGFKIPKGVNGDSAEKEKVGKVLEAFLQIEGAVKNTEYEFKRIFDILNGVNKKLLKDFHFVAPSQGANKFVCFVEDSTIDKIIEAANDNSKALLDETDDDQNPDVKYSAAYKTYIQAPAPEQIIGNHIIMENYVSAPSIKTLAKSANSIIKKLRGIKKTVSGTLAFADRKVSFSMNDDDADTCAKLMLKRYEGQTFYEDVLPVLTSILTPGDGNLFEFKYNKLPNETTIKGAKRLMVVAVLNKVATTPNLNIAGIKAVDNDHIYKRNYVIPHVKGKWDEYVKYAFDESIGIGIIRHFWNSITDAGKSTLDKLNPFAQVTGKWYQAGRKWKAETRGQILMSDTEGTTMYFSNGTLHHFADSDVHAIKFFCCHRI